MKTEDSSKFDILQKSKLDKFLIITLSAFATGFAWRMRGDKGFGGMVGMLIPATMLTLIIFFVWGNRKSIDPALIATMIILMAVTANGWGTLNGQITGVLRAIERTEPRFVAGYDIRVNPLSGIFAIFIVGFGWVPLWAIIVGLLFSSQQYKFKNFIKIALFYVLFRYLGELVLCHLIIPFVAPNAFDLFVDGLVAEGYDMIPWHAYLSHFKNDIWYESIAGGRNYAAMVSNLASCLGGVGAWLYMKVKMKDKAASDIMMKIMLIFGFSITVSDIFIFIKYGGLWRESITNPPEWLPGWSMWEYATGFVAGAFIMIMLFRYSAKKHTYSDNKSQIDDQSIRDNSSSYTVEIDENFLNLKRRNFYEFFVIFLALFGYGFCSATSSRLEKLGYEGIIPIIPYLLAIPGLIFYLLILYDKISFSSISKRMQCLWGIFISMLVWGFVYFILREPLPLSEWLGSMRPTMLVSLFLTIILVIIIYKRSKSRES